MSKANALGRGTVVSQVQVGALPESGEGLYCHGCVRDALPHNMEALGQYFVLVHLLLFFTRLSF